MKDHPPTGIIRTLPLIYADPAHAACINYRASIEAMAEDEDYTIAFALATKPKQDFLHVYLVIAGKVDARFNFVGYREGKPCRLWDGTVRHPKAWAVCCGPASRPPEPIHRRGFRGFRYVTEPLW